LASGADVALAISSYAGAGPPADTGTELNLAWTSDERDCLDIDLDALVRRELAAELDQGLPSVHRYPVGDPYGETALGTAVASHFGLRAPPAGLTCGAGVGPLLHGLARLAHEGVAGVVGHVYPDFPHWVGRCGGRCAPWRPGDPPPDVLFLERPALLGDQVELAALQELCGTTGGLVLVDESNANYCPPSFSAATAVASVPNLVVVRGLSKAYGLGGLRLSYCLAGADALEAVRGCVPPLLTSTLALRIGHTVLAAGDVTAGLRSRIVAARRQAHALLSDAGIPPTLTAADPFPYLLFTGPARPARLAEAGIRGKEHLYWNDGPGRCFRLSVPLHPARAARMALLLSR
jgi:histidinol-phosphate/aromatic aminotransferase/cobyric acid decarboxylase-like protein